MVIEPLGDFSYFARSAFTHFGLWQKLYNCSRHLEARKCLIKRDLLTFLQISNCLAAVSKANFQTPQFRGQDGCGDRDTPIRQVAHGFLLAAYRHIGSISYCFELFSWLQKRFLPSVCPPVGHGYDDKCCPGIYCFVVEQKRLKSPVTHTATCTMVQPQDESIVANKG